MDLDEFVGDVSSELFCSVCTGVLGGMPRACREGHNFCEECINHWLDDGHGNCPVDCLPLSKDGLFKNRALANMIAELDVYCSNCGGDGGCSWTGTTSAREQHLSGECELEPVQCPHHGCSIRPLRPSVADHAAGCGHRVVLCGDCGQQHKHREGDSHRADECPEALVECPNECPTSPFARKSVQVHLDDCPLQPVNCPHDGCGERVQRLSVADHSARCGHRLVSCRLFVAACLGSPKCAGAPTVGYLGGA